MENAQSRKAELSAPNSANFTSEHQKTLAGELSQYNRLKGLYERAGLNLYPLDGSSLLATSARYQMHKVLPDLRTAAIFLRQIGGAA